MLDELEQLEEEYHMPHELLELILGAIAIDSKGLKSDKTTETGLLLGLGVEYAIDAHWSVKGEFDYINFGSQSIAMNGDIPYVAKIRNDQDLFKVGGNYRF